MDIDLQQLPIPDWGLTCPGCDYPLKGLPSHRCPECGRELVMDELVHPWTRLRPPRFTGDELPLPDFGLLCRACNAPLAGARSYTCGMCGEPFDPARLRPAGEWFVLDSALTGGLPFPGVQALLLAEYVPHFVSDERGLREIYAGQGTLASRLRVPTEFYFEVLWLLARARHEVAAVRSRPRAAWKCPKCRESNPAHFEVCWKCERSRR